MRTRHLAPVLMALIALVAVIAVKLFTTTISSIYARQAIAAPAHVPAADSPIPTMKIAPAPVIDPDAERFVGTGDGSAGAWVRPDHHAR